MIYYFRMKNEAGVDNDFYLSADNQKQLYNRISFTYGVTRDNVTLLAEYKETGLESYELHKSYIDTPKEKKVDQKIIDKARELIKNKKYRQGKDKTDYIERHNFKWSNITNEKDLYPLLEQYKTVKVYYETGEKRGTKVHYAVYK